MATQNEICSAIKNKKVVTFNYKGEGERTAELYRLGVNKDTLNDDVRAFQTAGESVSGTLNVWKLFDIAQITNLKPVVPATDIQFPRIGYTPKINSDKNLTTIKDCYVK